MERVILVDENDNELGTMEKMEAHQKGLLHRAFSVFVFNEKGEMLMQQRSLRKYHSGGLWSNACCSHPRKDETTIDAAQRRLKEEMGFETSLIKAFDFTYIASFSNGLSEHEFDHVFVGFYNGKIEPNFLEVESYAYRTFEKLEVGIKEYPDFFTEWFLIAYPKLKAWIKESKMMENYLL